MKTPTPPLAALRITAFGLVLLLASSASAFEPGPPCSSDDDCEDYEVCVTGPDPGCTGEEEMDCTMPIEGNCQVMEPAPSCEMDVDCPGDLYCMAGECRRVGSHNVECELDDDCDVGFRCAHFRYYRGCEVLPEPMQMCESDSDCGSAGVCLVLDIEDVYSVCLPAWMHPCESDAECTGAAGELQCTEGGPESGLPGTWCLPWETRSCEAETPCGPGYSCMDNDGQPTDDGTCIAERQTCSGNDDCSDGWLCVDDRDEFFFGMPDESSDETMVCVAWYMVDFRDALPPDYGNDRDERGVPAGEAGNGDDAQTGDEADTQTDSGAPGADTGESSGSSGCAVAAPASPAILLLLALLALYRRPSNAA